MWHGIELIFSASTVILTFYFVGAILQNKRDTYAALKFFVIVAALAATFISSSFFRENIFFVLAITFFSAFAFGLVFFRCKIFGASIAAFFTVMAGGVSELIVVFLTASFHGVVISELVQYYTFYHVYARVLIILFMIILVVLAKHFRKGSMVAANAKTALAVMPIVSIFVLKQFIAHFIELPYAPDIREIIPIISIAVVNIFIFVFVEIIIRQNEKAQKLIIVETQNEAHRSHIELLMQNQNEIRTMTHDFRQQVQELYTLCEEKRYDELSQKLTELSERREKNLLADTGNTMLDSILTSKIEIAAKSEIDFKRELDVEPKLGYINSEICVLLGNALDNAIEACMRSKNEKFIGMELTATQNQFLCHIINTVGTTPQTEGAFLKTSKANSLHHGVGLQSMSQICENLGGKMNYSYDEKYFNVWIEICRIGKKTVE
jgi:hypothetical protein